MDKVDREWLHKTMERKPDGYKMWISKQQTGFRGTGIQVGYYSGQVNRDIGLSTCGDKETAAHLGVCPDEGRTMLLTENVDDLENWLKLDWLSMGIWAYASIRAVDV